MGSNKKPFFRVVVTDMRRPNAGRFIEALGWYDPKKKGKNYELRVDRIEYWKNKGAGVSDTVNSLLKKAKKEPDRVAVPIVAPAGA
jgi:small subunit ribosomal protein S16